VLVSLQGARTKAKETKFLVEMNEWKKALELYRLDNGKYPGAFTSDYSWHSTGGVACNVQFHSMTEANVFDQTFNTKYMSVLPAQLATCGILYMAFDGSERTSTRCAYQGPGGAVVNIDPDGKNAGSPDTEPYSYVFLVTLLTNLPNTTYPVAYSAGNPDFNSLSRCILGPKL
jgi:type II secretory pathway pseudopilin PulG